MTTSYGCRYSAGRLYPPADAPTTQPAVDPEQRIGDAERERASTELRAQFTAGRLDVEEFSARLDEVWAATTAGDLQQVMRDLPPPQPVAGPPPVWEARPWEHPRWQPPGRARRFLVGAVVLTLVWLLTTPGGAFWPIWPLAIWGWIVLVRRPRRAFRRAERA